MKRELSSGTLSVNRLGQLLLVRPTGRKKWAIPKGHVELGETPEQAACRETYEETGTTVRIVRAVPGFTLDNRHCHKDISVFLATIEGGTLRPDGAETEEVGLFALDALPKIIQSQARWLASVLPIVRSVVIEQVAHEACPDISQHVNGVPVVEQDQSPIGCDTPMR